MSLTDVMTDEVTGVEKKQCHTQEIKGIHTIEKICYHCNLIRASTKHVNLEVTISQFFLFSKLFKPDFSYRRQMLTRAKFHWRENDSS